MVIHQEFSLGSDVQIAQDSDPVSNLLGFLNLVKVLEVRNEQRVVQDRVIKHLSG